MAKLCKKEHYSGCRTYELELTDKMVGKFNIYLMDSSSTPVPMVTMEQIVAAYNCELDEDVLGFATMYNKYQYPINDVICEYFSDKIYCYGDSDIDYEDTDDTEDWGNME